MRVLPAGIVTVFLILGSGFASQSLRAAPPPLGRGSEFEDAPDPLTPKRPRSDVDQDRVTAAALFTHGRMLLQRQEFAPALRKFQRAWRCDPDSVTILEEIVPVAFELKRNDEAARYAVLAAERAPRDAALLVQLAGYVSEQKDEPRALALFTKALALLKDAPNKPAELLIHLEMGRLHFLASDYKAAAASFAHLREFFDQPNQPEVPEPLKKTLLEKPDRTLTLMAEAFLEAGRHDEAAALFRQANENKKNDDWLAYQLARIDAAQDKHAAALEKLNRYLDANLSEAGVEPFELLATLLRKQNPDAKAADAELRRRLTELRNKFPDNLPAGYYLADQLRHAEEFDAAEKLFLDLFKRQPAPDVVQGLIDIYRRRGQVEPLLKTLGEASLKTGSLESLGDEWAALVKDEPLVQKLLDRARQKDAAPLPDGAALAAAQLAMAAKKFDVADECYELALQSPAPPRHQLLGGWGLAMFSAAQADRAARVFQRMIDEKVKPEENHNYYYFLAGALALSDRTDDALAAAKKSLAAKPKSARLQSRLAWILYHAKRYEDAETSYRQLLKDFDADHTSLETREVLRDTRLILSNIAVHTKRLPEAEEWLEQVLDEFPEDIGAQNDLGYLWADQNKHLSRSLAMVQRAVAKEPENKAYRDSLGWVFYRLGRFAQAVQELKKAAEVDEPDGVILDHLGDAHLKANQRDQAVAAWQQAVESFKKENEPDKARQTTAKIEQHTKP